MRLKEIFLNNSVNAGEEGHLLKALQCRRNVTDKVKEDTCTLEYMRANSL